MGGQLQEILDFIQCDDVKKGEVIDYKNREEQKDRLRAMCEESKRDK